MITTTHTIPLVIQLNDTKVQSNVEFEIDSTYESLEILKITAISPVNGNNVEISQDDLDESEYERFEGAVYDLFDL